MPARASLRALRTVRSRLIRPRAARDRGRRWPRALLPLLSALLALGTGVVFAADGLDSTYVIGNNGNDGYWDRFGVSHPSRHHRVQCEPPQSGTYPDGAACGWGPGDWSLDYYGAPATPVRFHARWAGTNVFAARVWALKSTCNGDSNVGGWTVYVDVYLNGRWEGWISFGHLAFPQVSPGQYLSTGETLGYLWDWGYQPRCYQVTNPAGVHTHIEMYNHSRYACYIRHESGTLLDYPEGLGHVGRTRYGGPRIACD